MNQRIRSEMEAKAEQKSADLPPGFSHPSFVSPETNEKSPLTCHDQRASERSNPFIATGGSFTNKEITVNRSLYFLVKISGSQL